MQARMQNPASLLPGAIVAIQALYGSLHQGKLSPTTTQLVHLRVSQINGCSACVLSARQAKSAGESDDRLLTVAAWRDAPFFTDAERAALELAESVTRLADRSDPVPDVVWNQATAYFDEEEIAALVFSIALTNLFNRLNVTTRQVAGAWG